MIHDLQQEDSLSPDRVGAKAALLARASKAGMPILPGFVVSGEASRHHIEVGVRALEARGSGGARLAVIREPISFGPELIEAGSLLGRRLIARSSTTLEGSGKWAGAFSSLQDLAPDDLPRALTGVWASAFSVAALDRQQSAGVEPGSFTMPVLVQRAIDPASGGVAELEPDGTVVVHVVKGPPGPLLQGWVTEHRAHRSREDGAWVGSDAIDIVGIAGLDLLAASLLKGHHQLGVNRCEWALDREVWILQLDSLSRPRPTTSGEAAIEPADPALLKVARAAVRAPDKLADELVMPWALAGIPTTGHAALARPADPLEEAMKLSAQLASQVWELQPEQAADAARRCISELLGSEPLRAVDRLRLLNPPDPDLAASLMALVDLIRSERAPGRTRMGVGRWEPFVAAVVLGSGDTHLGTPASPGIGAGIQFRMVEGAEANRGVHRAVVTAGWPVPALASLIWDAAGLVTEMGSPAAHLFETARSLMVPAVCGVPLRSDSEQIVAVDGYRGVVATLRLHEEA